MKRQFFFILFYLLTVTLFINYTQAQVTIGSNASPVNGALLQFKERDDDVNGANSNKGIMLPRLALTALSGDLATTMGQTAGTLNSAEHVGLVIYNVSVQGFPNRVCPGVHLWDGSEWKPVKSYPEMPAPIAGPTADLVDTRAAETNTYHTARFYSVSMEPCTGALTTIDAGIWMTENLNARFMPNGTAITQGFNAGTLNRYYNPPANTGADAARIKANGLQYSWAAATDQKGGTVDGLGNVDNIAGGGVANNEDGTTATGQNQLVRQGICPAGWHLPSDAEWLQLVQAVQLQPELYSTQTSATTANIGNAFKDPGEPFSSAGFQGTSKPATQGGFAALLVGFSNLNNNGAGYGVSSFFWTSSSFNTGNSWKHLLRYDNSIVEHSASARNNMFSVRCKKNTL